jgi:UDP-glucose 4-epimerase
MRILVTGAGGYIGAHLIQELMQSDFEILPLSGRSPAKFSRLNQLGIRGVAGDMKDQDFLEKVFSDFKPSVVVHLAGLKSPEESNSKNELYFNNNQKSLENVFNLAIQSNVKVFINASSSAVYGDLDSSSIKETDTGNPSSNYGRIKKFGEEFLSRSNPGSINVCSLRLFNVIGSSSPSLKESAKFHLVPATVTRIKSGLPPIIYGWDLPTTDGTAIRDYVHIKDVTYVIRRLVDFLIESVDFSQRNLIFNVGSGHGTSVLKVVQLIQEFLGSDFEVVKRPARSGDPISVVSDIEKISQLLDWKPKHSIEEMIFSSI